MEVGGGAIAATCDVDWTLLAASALCTANGLHCVS